jgi:signal recognition particle receptor subunit beta
MALLSLALSDDDLEVSEEIPMEREEQRRDRAGGAGARRPTGARSSSESGPDGTTKTRQSTGAREGRGGGKRDGERRTSGRNTRTQRDNDPYTNVARTVRRAVTPYLPPPVVNAIVEQTDPFLRPYAGDEGTMKVALSVLLAYAATRIVRLVTSRVLGKGRAVRDRDEHGDALADGASSAQSDRTVVICGPSSSGKTRLLYHVGYNANVDTVSSIKANVVVEDRTRYVDWPGTAKLNSDAFRSLLLQARPRVVLVLDSTQAVALAADCVHQIFSILHASNDPPLTVLVLCHKSDLPTAKNPKRIQLQLRGELERLLKSNAAKAAAGSSSSSDAPTTKSSGQAKDLWWPVGEPVDFEALKFVRLLFRSTSCEGKGCRGLVREYCETGTLGDVE